MFAPYSYEFGRYPAARPCWTFLAGRTRLMAILGVALAATGCAGAPRGALPEVTSEVPPEVKTRVFGRWTCGAELPRGRPTSTFELLRHLGPGKAWDLEVDEDGLATLQVVGTTDEPATAAGPR